MPTGKSFKIVLNLVRNANDAIIEAGPQVGRAPLGSAMTEERIRRRGSTTASAFPLTI